MLEWLQLAALGFSIVAMGVAGVVAWSTRPAVDTASRLTRVEMELPGWRSAMERMLEEDRATREEIADRQRRIANRENRGKRTEQDELAAQPQPVTRADRVASVRQRYLAGRR